MVFVAILSLFLAWPQLPVPTPEHPVHLPTPEHQEEPHQGLVRRQACFPRAHLALVARRPVPTAPLPAPTVRPPVLHFLLTGVLLPAHTVRPPAELLAPTARVLRAHTARRRPVLLLTGSLGRAWHRVRLGQPSHQHCTPRPRKDRLPCSHREGERRL